MYIVEWNPWLHDFSTNKTDDMQLKILDTEDNSTTVMLASALLDYLAKGQLREEKFSNIWFTPNFAKIDTDGEQGHWSGSRQRSKETVDFMGDNYPVHLVTKSTFNNYKRNGYTLKEKPHVCYTVTLGIRQIISDWNLGKDSVIHMKGVELWAAEGTGRRGSPKQHLMIMYEDGTTYIIDRDSLRAGVLRFRTSDNKQWGYATISEFGTQGIENGYVQSGIEAYLSYIGFENGRMFIELSGIPVDTYRVSTVGIKYITARIFLDRLPALHFHKGLVMRTTTLVGKDIHDFNGFDDTYRRTHQKNNRY